MAVNCTAVPRELMGSEFFGHEKGAFAGATARLRGRFQQAEQGTLFLDEVGDLDLAIQGKLLRVLQEREVTRVGGERSEAVDVRVVAATNRDLEALVRDGRFRDDLYYRLDVIPIRLPPLRERPGDLTALLDHFLQSFVPPRAETGPAAIGRWHPVPDVHIRSRPARRVRPRAGAPAFRRLARRAPWQAACDGAAGNDLEALMTTTRGMSLLSVPLALVAATAGLALGVGAYAFHYAKGSSYLGNDPATCANCHVMQAHYQGWQAAPHHKVATCNDCHTPPGLVAKYVVKALNGYHHSMAFTTGDYPDVIRARPMSTAVVEANCRHCHADLVENVAHGGGVSCIRCHASVGHLR